MAVIVPISNLSSPAGRDEIKFSVRMSIAFPMTWSNDVKPKDTLQDAGNQNRRDFIKSGTASIAAGLSAGVIASPASDEAMSKDKTPAVAAKAVTDTMPTRNLGKTGYRVGIFGLGGQAALDKANNESLALQMIHRALELGVNYFDTSAIYGGPDRWSERHLGKGLKGNRDQVVIATKTKERTRDAALKDLDVSLKLLDTDHIDIWQSWRHRSPGSSARPENGAPSWRYRPLPSRSTRGIHTPLSL